MYETVSTTTRGRILLRMAAASAPATAPASKRDRTHYLYLSVIVAVVLGIVVGLVAPDVRQGRPTARHGVHRPDQDDDLAHHLLHDRAGHRLDPEGRAGRQGRRDRAGLLRRDVDDRAGDRPAGRQHHPAGRGPARRGAGALPGTGGEGHGRLPARGHPDHPVLPADRRQRAVDAVRRPARGLRAAGDGPHGRAGAPRTRLRGEAGVPGTGHDHVGGADRRVRRDRGRGRRRGLGGARRAGLGDARLLHHLRAVRAHRARHGAAGGHRPQHPEAAALPRPGVPADRVDVVVGVGAAAADREDGARGRLAPGRRHHRAHGLLVQPRRHRDLPDHGLAVHRRRDGQAARASASRSACSSS